METLIFVVFVYVIFSIVLSPISLGLAEELGWVKNKIFYPGDYSWSQNAKIIMHHLAVCTFFSLALLIPTLVIILAFIVLITMVSFETKKTAEVSKS